MKRTVDLIDFGELYRVEADRYIMWTKGGCDTVLEGEEVTLDHGAIVIPWDIDRYRTSDAAISVLTTKGVLWTLAHDFYTFTERYA